LSEVTPERILQCGGTEGCTECSQQAYAYLAGFYDRNNSIPTQTEMRKRIESVDPPTINQMRAMLGYPKLPEPIRRIQEREPQPVIPTISLDEIDSRLLWVLRAAGREWGPRGVAEAATMLIIPDL
jgi:hypothetical protein